MAGVPNGTASVPTVIQVMGKCVGPPVLIQGRSNIVIVGETPPGFTRPPLLNTVDDAARAAGCRAKGPQPEDLRATIAPDPNAPIPSGSNGEAIKIVSSTNVSVWYLNVVDADPHDGLEYKNATDGVAFCNCISRNDEGLQLHAGSGQDLLQNTVCENENGINVRHAAKTANVVDNTSFNNNRVPTGEAPTTPPRHGISLIEGSTENVVRGNVVFDNGQDGIQLEDANVNKVLNNDVRTNGFNNPPGGTPAGIELLRSDDNCINGNIIRDNADGLVDKVKILDPSGSTGNTGTNVPPDMTPCS